MKKMTPADIKAARLSLKTKSGRPMTQAQLASVMDLDPLTVSRIERGVRPAPVRYVRLLQAYLKRHRPKDWPR